MDTHLGMRTAWNSALGLGSMPGFWEGSEVPVRRPPPPAAGDIRPEERGEVGSSGSWHHGLALAGTFRSIPPYRYVTRKFVEAHND